MLPYVFMSASADVLHLLHEALAAMILAVVAVMFVHLSVMTVLRVRLASMGIEEITNRNSLVRKVMTLCRLAFSAVLHISHRFYEGFELRVLERFNRVLADAMGGICDKLALKLDVVEDYYVAITWFIVGAVASITILFLVR